MDTIRSLALPAILVLSLGMATVPISWDVRLGGGRTSGEVTEPAPDPPGAAAGASVAESSLPAESTIESKAHSPDAWQKMSLVVGLAVHCLALLWIIMGVRGDEMGEGKDSPGTTPLNWAQRTKRFDRALLGVGMYLVLISMAAGASLAGLMATNRLVDEPSNAADKGLYALLATLLAMTGALFYVCNSLREKRDGEAASDSPGEHRGGEEWDESWFWTGLFLRSAEAALFSIVIFLVFAITKAGGYMLLVTALLIGMFIKAGERLIFGLAQRVFAMAEAALPIGPAPGPTNPPPPPPPGNSSASLNARGTLPPGNVPPPAAPLAPPPPANPPLDAATSGALGARPDFTQSEGGAPSNGSPNRAAGTADLPGGGGQAGTVTVTAGDNGPRL